APVSPVRPAPSAVPSACSRALALLLSFFVAHPPPPDIYTLSLHDALPIYADPAVGPRDRRRGAPPRPRLPVGGAHRPHPGGRHRSEEHTSELQSRFDLVCRLLLEKKKGNDQGEPRRPGGAVRALQPGAGLA